MKTTISIKGIAEAIAKSGSKYWKIQTDQGNMTCFEPEILTVLKERMSKGQFVQIEMIESDDKKFKNIRGIIEDNVSDVKEEKVSESKEDSFIEARKLKDQSIYTSYAKDVFCKLVDIELSRAKQEPNINCTDLMRLATVLVKQGKDEFKEG